MNQSKHRVAAIAALIVSHSTGASIADEARSFAAQRDHDAIMARLSALGGGAFEPAFLADAVAFHTAAIDAVKTILLPAATNADLRAQFQGAPPALEKHL